MYFVKFTTASNASQATIFSHIKAIGSLIILHWTILFKKEKVQVYIIIWYQVWRLIIRLYIWTYQISGWKDHPCIVMPECYASSQRVDSLARVVITPVRHTHTRLHTPLSNICSSPSRLEHSRGLISPACLLPQPYPQCSVYWGQAYWYCITDKENRYWAPM